MQVAQSTALRLQIKLTWFEFDFRRVLVQNSGLIVSLKRKKPTQWAGWWLRKKFF